MKVLIVNDTLLLNSQLKEALYAVERTIKIRQVKLINDARAAFIPFGPDLVIMDLAYYQGSGIILLQEFKEVNPAVESIILPNIQMPNLKTVVCGWLLITFLKNRKRKLLRSASVKVENPAVR